MAFCPRGDAKCKGGFIDNMCAVEIALKSLGVTYYAELVTQVVDHSQYLSKHVPTHSLFTDILLT